MGADTGGNEVSLSNSSPGLIFALLDRPHRCLCVSSDQATSKYERLFDAVGKLVLGERV